MQIEIILAAAAIIAGGVLKGATGAGAPIVAVPTLALIYDIRYAVAVFALPNLFTNLWQWWQFRKHRLPGRFSWLFIGGGAAGVVAGTTLLAYLPPQMLLYAAGVVVVIYIAFRSLKPAWALPLEQAVRLALPAGFVGGMLQGASGVSAPVSLTFLNSMKLDRPVFIATISAFFTVMSLFQLPALASVGILTVHRALLGLVALALLLASMPVGSMLARHASKETFDRIILALLAAIAAKILLTPLF